MMDTSSVWLFVKSIFLFHLYFRLKSSGTKPSFRLAHKVLCFDSHPQLLGLLNFLLRLSPSLASPDVINYLKDAGIDVAEVLKKGTTKSRLQRI